MLRKTKISKTAITQVLRECGFDPKQNHKLAYVASMGSLEYWEIQMKVLLDTLNQRANVVPDTLTASTYITTMQRIIQHAAFCIIEARARTNDGPANP